jgi:anthranilate synthase component 2
MILLIDNYDSFTYNLYQQIERLGGEVGVVKNDEVTVNDIKKMDLSAIVISPGPGRPEDAGISVKIIEAFYEKLPILGVCLGHQAIGLCFGAKIVGAKKILHGKTALITHRNSGVFKGLKGQFMAARYHSLVINKVPRDFKLSAWTEGNEIMGIQHENLPVFGIQFHPESFMTECGDKIIKNFLNVSKSY